MTIEAEETNLMRLLKTLEILGEKIIFYDLPN